jgi:hypothetical protein
MLLPDFERLLAARAEAGSVSPAASPGERVEAER